MGLLYWFESIRTPLLDKFFLAVTTMGDELFFIALALCIFWCINKNTGYYLITVCFFGLVLNQTLKMTFKTPRPWQKDPLFTIVEAAREASKGYSFPSGHTQNAVSIFSCICMDAGYMIKRRRNVNIFRAVCIFVAAMVAVSRMYLGVHTPADVLFSALVALIIVLAFRPFFKKFDAHPGRFYYIIAAMLLLSAGYLVFSCTHAADNADHNISSGIEHAWYMLGGICGVAVAYPLERRYVNFNTKAGFVGQALKLVLGCAAVLVIKSSLKAPLLLLFNGNPAVHAIRYFVTVVFAVFVWPMTFKFFAKINSKEA